MRMKRITFRIPEKTYSRLVSMKAATGQSINDQLIDAVDLLYSDRSSVRHVRDAMRAVGAVREGSADEQVF